MNKIIHYCWFGGNPLPDEAKKCIESWKKNFPDYQVKEWNESNYDVNCCSYSKEAYSKKKWAFVSDLARFKILREYGGIYFDTDVEVIRNFQDIIDNGSYMGCEGINVNPGLGFGINNNSTQVNAILDEIINFYYSISFINYDGTINQTTIVKYTTDILKKHGYICNGDNQDIEGIKIYSEEYFCPLNPNNGELHITENTCSIHHYTASWFGDKENYIVKISKKFQKILGRNFSKKLAVLIATIKYDGLKYALKKFFNR